MEIKTKYCSKYKKGTCCSTINPMPALNQYFGPYKKNPDGLKSQCRFCNRKDANERNSIQEIRILKNKKEKEYRKRPEVKTRMKKYRTDPKNREKRREWRKTEKGYKSTRDSVLKTLYGINLEQYEKKFKEQEGKCKICKKEETCIEYKTGKIKSLSVDHDHKTGKIRGLLCSRHNQGIGLFDDSIELLQNAINYLKENNNET